MTLPALAHLYTTEEYLKLVNQEAALYYTNPYRALSNEEASTTKWSLAGAWSLPYARGTLYFADLDAKLEVRHSKISVLHLVNLMNARILAGAPRTDETWLQLLREEVGGWAVQDWMSMRAGQVIFPVVGAFGRGLTGERIQAGVFALGFLPAQTSAGTVIQSVQDGSPAAVAGLRGGDIIVETVDLLPFTSSYDRSLPLHIWRNGEDKNVTFNPHLDQKVLSMNWRVPETGDSGHLQARPRRRKQSPAPKMVSSLKASMPFNHHETWNRTAGVSDRQV